MSFFSFSDVASDVTSSYKYVYEDVTLGGGRGLICPYMSFLTLQAGLVQENGGCEKGV